MMVYHPSAIGSIVESPSDNHTIRLFSRVILGCTVKSTIPNPCIVFEFELTIDCEAPSNTELRFRVFAFSNSRFRIPVQPKDSRVTEAHHYQNKTHELRAVSTDDDSDETAVYHRSTHLRAASGSSKMARIPLHRVIDSRARVYKG